MTACQLCWCIGGKCQMVETPQFVTTYTSMYSWTFVAIFRKKISPKLLSSASSMTKADKIKATINFSFASLFVGISWAKIG